jgi:hypothetical protein
MRAAASPRGAPGTVATLDGAKVAAALTILARAIAPHLARAVVDELVAGRNDEWIDQAASPLGSRRHCRLIREGAIPGMQAGRRWLARRDDVSAYIDAQSKRKRRKPENDVADLAAELGLRVVWGGPMTCRNAVLVEPGGRAEIGPVSAVRVGRRSGQLSYRSAATCRGVSRRRAP